MNEDNVCEVTLVRTPQGDYTLAGIDDYLNEVGDIGDAASRQKRRLDRKKRRYSKTSKSSRKAAIAARLAVRIAARAGKTKKGFLGSKVSKAARNARRAARKGASVEAAVIAGLTAIGLSKTSAKTYAKRAIALLSGKKTKSKKKGTKGTVIAVTSVSAADQKLITSATKEENDAEASGEADEDADEDSENAGDEFEGEDAEFDEEYDSGPGGTEVAGYGALPTIDRVKPFVPWIVLGIGALAIWKFSTPEAALPEKTPARKKR